MKLNELNEILRLHKLWLAGEVGGVQADLKGADLECADLKGAILAAADLREANLIMANLEGANLKDADLRRAILEGANLAEANLRRAILEGANLSNADLKEANLSRANLNGANNKGANLKSANLEYANLAGANLTVADLREANLRGANLSEAHLECARLCGAELTRANLNEANLKGADLANAYLECAHLEGANLDGANLECAELGGTNLKGARLSWANLKGADLDYACWPLWCGSLDVTVDSKIASQLVYHTVRACQSVTDDADIVEVCKNPALIKLANRFHHADECGQIEVKEGCEMSTKSYAMETRDRLVEAGNFADADTEVDDIVQIIEDDEREINRLEAENNKMREALRIIAGGKEARGSYEEVAWHMAQLAAEALAAKGDAK